MLGAYTARILRNVCRSTTVQTQIASHMKYIMDVAYVLRVVLQNYDDGIELPANARRQLQQAMTRPKITTSFASLKEDDFEVIIHQKSTNMKCFDFLELAISIDAEFEVWIFLEMSISLGEGIQDLKRKFKLQI